MTPQEVLLKAADLIENNGWTQNFMARNVEGLSVNQLSIEASCFCILGAMLNISGNHADDAAKILRDHLNIPHIAMWNDNPSRTKEEVINALREAAKLC